MGVDVHQHGHLPAWIELYPGRHELFLRNRTYKYYHGISWRAVAALGAGTGVALVRLIAPAIRFLFDYSWFVGFGVAFLGYYFLMRGTRLTMGGRNNE